MRGRRGSVAGGWDAGGGARGTKSHVARGGNGPEGGTGETGGGSRAGATARANNAHSCCTGHLACPRPACRRGRTSRARRPPAPEARGSRGWAWVYAFSSRRARPPRPARPRPRPRRCSAVAPRDASSGFAPPTPRRHPPAPCPAPPRTPSSRARSLTRGVSRWNFLDRRRARPRARVSHRASVTARRCLAGATSVDGELRLGRPAETGRPYTGMGKPYRRLDESQLVDSAPTRDFRAPLGTGGVHARSPALESIFALRGRPRPTGAWAGTMRGDGCRLRRAAGVRGRAPISRTRPALTR